MIYSKETMVIHNKMNSSAEEEENKLYGYINALKNRLREVSSLGVISPPNLPCIYFSSGNCKQNGKMHIYSHGQSFPFVPCGACQVENHIMR